MSKSTIEPNSYKGTMGPVGLQGSAGHFGLKKHINIPPSSDDEAVEEIVPEIKEGESIPMLEEETPEIKEEEALKEEPVKVAEEAPVIESTLNVKEEDIDEKGLVEDIEESFDCPVCGKSFSKRIALMGHLRGPCGKKIKK